MFVDIKQRGNRFSIVDTFDGFSQKRSDADDFDLAVESIGDGNRIGGDQLFDFGSCQKFRFTDLAEQETAA